MTMEPNMTKSLSLTIVFLFLSTTAMMLSGKQGTVTNIRTRGHFVGVGAWRLASLETEGADGKIHKADSTGLLVFTQDGHMSVQVMERYPQPQTPPRRTNTPKAATKPPSAPMRSTQTPQSSPSTLRARWSAPSSAKTSRAHSSTPANS
jgi:hypothetical protein